MVVCPLAGEGDPDGSPSPCFVTLQLDGRAGPEMQLSPVFVPVEKALGAFFHRHARLVVEQAPCLVDISKGGSDIRSRHGRLTKTRLRLRERCECVHEIAQQYWLTAPQIDHLVSEA